MTDTTALILFRQTEPICVIYSFDKPIYFNQLLFTTTVSGMIKPVIHYSFQF